jgi:copper(I)-binding protein
MPHPRLLPLLLALIATAALFASCGSTHDDMDMSSTGGTGSGTFEITDAWAASASMHETVMADDASADDMDMGDGSMTMQQVDSVEIPAGGLVAFKPGGLHVMLMGLTAPLTAGQTFDMTLQFETAGAKRVSVTVKDG